MITGRVNRAGGRAAVALAAVCVVLAGAGAAHAYSYTVSVCGSGGWESMPYGANNYVNIASAQNCDGATGSGHGLQVWSTGGATPGANAGGYWFTAPAGTSVTHLAFTGDFSEWDGWTAHWATSSDGAGDVGDPCASYSTDCNFGLEYGTGSQSVAVDDAAGVGFAIWCHASSCPKNDSDSIYGPAASANVYSAQITVSEPNAPTVAGGGNLWAAGGSWVSGIAAPAGGWTVSFGGADPAGVCELQAQLVNSSGQVVQADSSNDVGADFTAAAPCGTSSRSGSWQPNIAALANGSYQLQLVATNPSDVQSGQAGAVASETVNVDNQAPPPVAGLTASSAGMGPSGWSSTSEFTLAWSGQQDYPGPQSPVTTANVSVAGVSSAQQSASQTTANVTVGNAAGGYSASVWEQDQAGNQASPQSVALYYDPNPPSAPSFGPARATWIGASQAQIPEALSATAGGPSGIYGYSVAVDGQPSDDWHDANVKADGGVNGSFDISGLADGVHQLCAVAFSGAGVAGPQACTTVRIDRQPPTTTITSSAPQSATSWVGEPVVLTIACTDQPGLSGCQSVSYQLDGGPVQTVTGSTAQVTVSTSGAHTLSAWSTDNAGNVGQAASQQALVDLGAPTGYFEPPDQSDPQQLQVAVVDPYSGVASGQIQLQLNGSWTALPTSYANGELTATAQDDQLPHGSWAVRALVWNAVGTQATISSYANGVAVTHSIPARIQTILRVGHTEIVKRICVRRVEKVKPKRIKGRRARNQHPTARLVRVCRDRLVPKHAPVRLAAPRTLVVDGLLETAAGQPIEHGLIQGTYTAQGWTTRTLSTAGTSSKGAFRLRLPPGGSGQAAFVFAGTDTLGNSHATISVGVRGEIVAHIPTRLIHGRDGARILRVSGRMLGGYIPPGGVAIQPEYIELGQPADSWAPFGSPIYTNRKGKWSRDIPIATQAQGHLYKLRFVVNKQAEWPFAATASKVYKRRL